MKHLVPRSVLAVVAATTAMTLAVTTPGRAEQPSDTYGADDAGGFRNVLPPGEQGVDNSAQAQAFFGSGALPPHWADQQPLYQNLLYASPRLTDKQIPLYYKDATFGVKAGDVESTVSPRPGVTIVRDADYGVPHIYGKTRSDSVFGAGYAGAADRLFLMDVLRHTGRATLASFLGGSNLGSDEQQWRFAPYTEADLDKQLTQTGDSGKSGRQVVKDVKSYAAGVNAYIDAARKDPGLMPVEYALFGKQLEAWKPTDVLATASLIGGIFGRGGGGEVTSSEVLRALQQRFGTKQGRQIWTGFRSKNDTEAPTTTSGRFPYMTTDSFASPGLAIPAAGSVTPSTVVSGVGLTAQQADPSGSQDSSMSSFGDVIRQSLQPAHASNWELVAAKHSKNGHPLAVMGPQVGYYLPQILMEMDIHGPGIDARGAAFAGVNLYVQMGHGKDYAWSATSAGSDNVDTFAEVLCGGDDHHYRYKGKCRAMQRLVQHNTWQPNVIDHTAAGSATLTSYRTVHGIVNAYGRSHGKRVAFATARTTYFHEGDSVVGFMHLNDPTFVKGPKSFQKAAAGVNFTVNWSYADAKHTAYFLSGAYPKRAAGTSTDFPILGTGKFDWQGFDPKTWTESLLPAAKHPQVIDPGVLVSWNNKPAKGWSAADRQWGYGPLYRSQFIAGKIRDDINSGRKLTRAQVIQAMEESATQDIRGKKLLPILLKAVGTPSDPQLQSALQTLRDWLAAGAHRRDLDQDGVYEHNAAVELMDAWWPELVAVEFRPTLGTEAYDAIRTMIPLGAEVGTSPRAPSFSDGWWGYVDKDLRSLFTPKDVKGGYSRIFCGNGKKSACRQDLQASLTAALAVTPAQMYGQGACTANPQPSCYDMNRPRVTAAINKPGPFPFQNRPTFQQVVSVLHHFKTR
jgi:acyl-homoserine lactone acylase PvdQ